MNNEILLKAMMAEDQMSAIRIYCEEISTIDEQLKKGLSDQEKSYDECWSYIMEKAKKHLDNKSGHINPKVVFGWAIHYFTEDRKTILEEVKIVKKQEVSIQENEGMKVSKTPHKEKNVVEEKKSDKLISIFDLGFDIDSKQD